VSLKLETKVKGNQPFLSVSDFENIQIPVPSLNIQERLVHLLDNFEAICTDLNIGLPAEIEARQKQYEYYRDKLLTFKNIEG
jgi:type I restriction enzyme S subunit